MGYVQTAIRKLITRTRGDKGRQGETRGDKTRGKADTPSNTGTYVIQWETVGDSGSQLYQNCTTLICGAHNFKQKLLLL